MEMMIRAILDTCRLDLNVTHVDTFFFLSITT